jgi:hypothetical protein
VELLRAPSCSWKRREEQEEEIKGRGREGKNRKKKEKKVGCVVALQRSAAKGKKKGWLRCSATKKMKKAGCAAVQQK